MQRPAPCTICGRPAAVLHSCQRCGAFCDSNCYNPRFGMCNKCAAEFER